MTSKFDVATAVDDLRQLVATADAFAYAAEELFEQTGWVRDEDDPRGVERLAHLIGATAAALMVATEAGDRLAANLAKPRREG